MYKQKSEIIEQIQSYHKQVAKLYYDLYERIDDEEMKSVIYNLYDHERSREEYLDKHKNIAKAMNCWLRVPCDKLSDQICECFKDMEIESELTIDKLIQTELYFDNCLIKLYNILAADVELSETVANIFYYMLKKTKEEEIMFSKMLFNSSNKVHYKLSPSK